MSELISGKEAKLAWANGMELQIDTGLGFEQLGDDYYLAVFDREGNKFRLKPRTIKINGIEVPAPFEPNKEQWNDIDIYYLDPSQSDGWNTDVWNEHFDLDLIQFGAWRTEEEIKQVVAALRSVFNETKESNPS